MARSETSKSLRRTGIYSQTSTKEGTSASAQAWRDHQLVIASLLWRDPDNLYHLVRSGARRLRATADAARRRVVELQDLVRSLSVDPVNLRAGAVQKVAERLRDLSDVFVLEDHAETRSAKVESSARDALAPLKGTAYQGGTLVKNREEALRDSRTAVSDLIIELDDFESRVQALVTAEEQHKDRWNYAGPFKRRADTAAAQVESVALTAYRREDVHQTSEHVSDILSAAVTLPQYSRYVSPSDAKATADAAATGAGSPAAVAATNHPPYRILPGGETLSVATDGAAPAAFTAPTATPARLKIPVTTPFRAAGSAAAVLTSTALVWANLLRTAGPVGITSIVPCSPLADAAGDPAVITMAGALFGSAQSGDLLDIDVGAVEMTRILAVQSTTVAVIEIPPSGNVTGGTNTVSAVYKDNRLPCSIDGVDIIPTVAELSIRTGGGPVGRVQIVADLNASTTAFTNPFADDGANHVITLTSPTTGEESSLSVSDTEPLIDSAGRFPLQDILELRDQTVAGALNEYILFLLNTVSGRFEPGEEVEYTTGAGSSSGDVVWFDAGSNVLLLRAYLPNAVDPSVGASVDAAFGGSGTTSLMTSFMPPPYAEGSDGGLDIELVTTDHGLHAAATVAVAAGYYATAAALQTALQAAFDAQAANWVFVELDSGVLYLTPDDGAGAAARGSGAWVRVEADAAPFGLYEGNEARGADVTLADIITAAEDQDVDFLVRDTPTPVATGVTITAAASGTAVTLPTSVALLPGDRIQFLDGTFAYSLAWNTIVTAGVGVATLVNPVAGPSTYIANIVRDGLRLESPTRAPTGSLQVSAGTLQALLALSTTKAVTGLSDVVLDDIDQPGSQTRPGDVIRIAAGDLSIERILAGSIFRVTPTVSGDLDDPCSIFALGAITYPTYRDALHVVWGAQQEVFGRRGALSGMLERAVRSPRRRSDYTDELTALYDALTAVIAVAVPGASQVSAMAAARRRMLDDRFDTAEELLGECRLTEFFDLYPEEASRLDAALQAVAQVGNELPPVDNETVSSDGYSAPAEETVEDRVQLFPESD
jgi:hypothetical protein